ncbi:peptidase S16 [Alginatibacterium sediminis]|uniref:Peptidase S16 n=1 Tax=Alginatibacterium sediminis TaxID=2164068 RepID=A0A420EHE6_9ALTE|nr:LON peptidase substrate-binding domain-containing protein [Alginatibacterium sediminis]RKF20161.1 peptidase S16 [Alginatibacterium sediminis]
MLPLFPLGILILPNGRTRLRIFEPRYKRLVAVASQRGGFVMCLPLVNGQLPLVGTQVNIEDFNQLEDGLLEITIIGQQRVLLSEATQEDDGLWFAKIDALENLPSIEVQDEYQLLAVSLLEILTELNLYSEVELLNVSDQTWLAQRWAELIPFTRDIQLQILQQQQAASLNKLVLDLVFTHIGKARTNYDA